MWRPLVLWLKVALEYLLKGPTASGEQVKAEVKSKLSDDHIKVRGGLENRDESTEVVWCLR